MGKTFLILISHSPASPEFRLFTDAPIRPSDAGYALRHSYRHTYHIPCELMVRISHQPTKPTIALRQNPKGEKILHNSHVRLSYLAGFLFPLNFTFGCTRFFVHNDITASTANFTQQNVKPDLQEIYRPYRRSFFYVLSSSN